MIRKKARMIFGLMGIGERILVVFGNGQGSGFATLSK